MYELRLSLAFHTSAGINKCRDPPSICSFPIVLDPKLNLNTENGQHELKYLNNANDTRLLST